MALSSAQSNYNDAPPSVNQDGSIQMTNFIFQNQQEGEKTTEMNNRWGGAFA